MGFPTLPMPNRVTTMDRFTQLELFVKVAETGGLGRAAEALGMSNAAASRHLASLEARLNARLVERNSRRLYLTHEGQQLFESARRLVSEIQEAEAALADNRADVTGVLRVGASLSFSLLQIAPRLRRYHELYPNVRVHIEAANRYPDLLDNGIDVAIRTREFEPDSTITIRRLGSTRRILCAAPSYLAERGTPTDPQDLFRHDFLTYVHAKNAHELQLSRDKESCVIHVQGPLESNDGQILRRAALDGLGILVQPSYIVCDDILAGRLLPILNDWDLPRLQINIAYPSRKHLSAKVRSFIDFMVNEFAVQRSEERSTNVPGCANGVKS
jgi:DNA-binding transcriptional LysR family regulator